MKQNINLKVKYKEFPWTAEGTESGNWEDILYFTKFVIQCLMSIHILVKLLKFGEINSLEVSPTLYSCQEYLTWI